MSAYTWFLFTTISWLSMYCCQSNVVKIVPDSAPPVSSVTVMYNDANGHGLQQSITTNDAQPVTVTIPAHTPFTIVYGASDPDGVQSIAIASTIYHASGSTENGLASTTTFKRDCPQGSQVGNATAYQWTGDVVAYDFEATGSDFNGNALGTRPLHIQKGP